MTKIKVKKKAADWAVFSFLKAAQIWSTRPMRYSPVQADQPAQSGNTDLGELNVPLNVYGGYDPWLLFCKHLYLTVDHAHPPRL